MTTACMKLKPVAFDRSIEGSMRLFRRLLAPQVWLPLVVLALVLVVMALAAA
jgi:hypothetical protein